MHILGTRRIYLFVKAHKYNLASDMENTNILKQQFSQHWKRENFTKYQHIIVIAM